MEQLLGPDFVWQTSDGNLYVGDTPWQPDASRAMIKMVFYLDPVDADSGCIRVIPGSHRSALHERLDDIHEEGADEAYGVTPDEVPAVPLESEPGDIVYFNQGLWHASFGGGIGRRMFTLNYHREPTEEGDVERLTDL